MRIALTMMLLVGLFAAGTTAQDVHLHDQDIDLKNAASAGEWQLLGLVRAFRADQNELRRELIAMEDQTKALEYYHAHNPVHQHMPKLLALEEEWRGKDAGLSALQQILVFTSSVQEGEGSSARKEAMRRLAHYADHPLTMFTIRMVRLGGSSPDVAQCLRELMNAPKATPEVKGYSQLELGILLSSMKNDADYVQMRLEELEAGAEAVSPLEQKHLAKLAEEFPPEPTLAKNEAEGIALLADLTHSATDIFAPNVRYLDDEGVILKREPGKTNGPSPASKAEGYHFQATHLRRGKPAPDLTVELIDGSQWSLAEQTAAGRVVLVHFSFKGCGPCEEMYPDLRAMHEKYGDRLAILAIMADSERSKTVEAAGSGKITWDVTWDGRPGKVTTKWGVSGFPTTWTVDLQGVIVDNGAVGIRLNELIAKLIAAPAQDE